MKLLVMGVYIQLIVHIGGHRVLGIVYLINVSGVMYE